MGSRFRAAWAIFGFGAIVWLALLIASYPARAASPIPSPQASEATSSGRLQKGDELDLRGCTYAPWETHAGRDSGQYLVDRNAYYSIVFLPTDVPGGHYRFSGSYPHGRFFSFESYDEFLASQDVLADDSIDPNAGSINPFQPGQFYRDGHANYSFDIFATPPSQRQNPHPHNVLYMGYRENSHYGNAEHSPYSPVLYRVYDAPGSPEGNVPLPHLKWVVDDPGSNPYQNATEACDGMEPGRAPNSAILNINEILNREVTSPTLSPAERNVDIPTDEIPRDPPYVNVLRPASNGYQGAYFNSKTPYVYIRPDAQHSRFVVVHFKAPTFTRVEQGVPATGKEQTRYWSWCDAQFVSPINVTQACLRDNQFHIDRQGYATLVISPPDQRPVVGGKPYADWMPWPGGGADLNMRQIDPNPNTFHQSPFFFPIMSSDDGLDYLRGFLFEPQLKAWMGSYFPQVSYCSTQQFQRDGCGSPSALQASPPPP